MSLAPIIGLMGITFAVMLEQRGLLDRVNSVDVRGERSTSYQLDPSMTNLAIGIAFLVFVLPIFAWGWWAVAATLNARAKSRQSGWPWTLPTSVLVAVAALVAAGFVPSGPRSILYGASAVAYSCGAYGVLLGLRTSARAIKADTVVWSRLIWIPPLSALSLFGAIKLADAVGSKAIAVFGSLVPFGLLLWAWLTICRAMAEFDQACRTSEVSGGDSTGLPAFMTGNRVAR